MNTKDRIKLIKKEYGENIFRVWGKRGGSPILRDWKKGQLVKKRRSCK